MQNGQDHSVENVLEMSSFEWTDERSLAALMLAEGYTQAETAEEVQVDVRTIRRWKADMEFSAEVDRLSLMIGIASRAERLRIAMRVARQKISDEGKVTTDKDLLDWLKFAQGETDGIRLDLATVAAAFGEDAASLARQGSSHMLIR